MPDTLIIGAGLSGLSLAVNLVERGAGGRIHIIDSRADFGWDRTWCFWPTQPHRFERAISRRWPSWRVAAAGRSVVRSARGLPYCHIASTDFYRAARARLAQHGRVELSLGTTAESIHATAADVKIETSAGTLKAGLVFDSRPASRPTRSDEITLLQHFAGQLIETDEASFRPDCVTLMDFEVSQAHGLHFMYVLPFGPQRALVEDTFISPAALPPSVYQANIADYLRRQLGIQRWRVVGRERGVIPMTTAAAPASPPRVIPIGLRGGLAKPSSGYAFLAVQRFSAALAARVAAAGPGRLVRSPVVRPAHTLALDRIFVAHLAESPEQAPELFLRLFETVPARSLVRFLSETGGLRDDLRVMRALPASPLVGAAWRSRHLWLRRG